MATQQEQTIAGLCQKVRSYNRRADIRGIRAAYDFAQRAHAGQFRKSGEDYIIHPLAVAYILSDLKLDAATIEAALLHDTVEDSPEVHLSTVSEQFGEEVANLVDGVTKLGEVDLKTTTEQQSESLRKMLIAMARDIRVILIKLADRLHNMRTLDALPPDRQLYKARETMEIYAPLAHRLGISQIKWELEDLAFSYLEPVKYEQVARLVQESRTAREAYGDAVMAQLRRELGRVGIKAEITGRPKHLYSIYQKMVKKDKDFSEIFDLIALRIITNNLKDVYGALGTVHNLFKPMPGRFKDYIAMPKFNMYQSLHTTVIGPEGRPIEIQIRTVEMHQMAEYGVAAHWRYKEGTVLDNFDERLAWLRQMMEWQGETTDSEEFMQALRVDLFEEEVFVFTPKGDVRSLKRGATPLDFAYAIHTEVGSHCVGAKVNGRIVPLAYHLRNGDRVEVLTNKGASPSRDWLDIVATSSARSKIKSWLSKTTRVSDALLGREELKKIMHKHGVSIASKRMEKALDGLAVEMNYATAEDLYAQIGGGKMSARLLGTRLLKYLSQQGLIEAPAAAAETTTRGSRPAVTGELTLEAQLPPTRAARRPKQAGGVRVKGIDDVLVHLAKCCNPVPGDEIVGFVTRGRGVSVHRATCPNCKDLQKNGERFIEVSWDQDARATYHVEVFIQALDRLRLLQDVTMRVAESGVNILSSSTTTHKDGLVDMRFLFEIGEMGNLEGLLRNLRGTEGVFEARRMLPGEQKVTKR
ncbi:MAG: bifunctional (p)ppGpp synthetase/guanosine-3',5'-bis(diphosphate) 3'-pyrophosphohydrolase [Actinomycetia bacterium]|nr:bifunctional (p)ppGpp synthetase/guanosine-3',5'-bis(diphosphate) 3'-pyrophosphohydrolase [Actinomycetes bacterium]